MEIDNKDIKQLATEDLQLKQLEVEKLRLESRVLALRTELEAKKRRTCWLQNCWSLFPVVLAGAVVVLFEVFKLD